MAQSLLSLSELERVLGPADQLTLTRKNAQHLRQWALAIGIEPVRVYAMTDADCVNLYHERGGQAKDGPTELQRIAADIFLRLHNAIQSEKVEPNWLRSIIIDEIEKLPPQRIEFVIPPLPVITINGPQHSITPNVIRIAALSHPIMLVGPAGCGKTTIGQKTSIALSLPFYITSTINEPHELTGFIDGNGYYHRTPFRDAFEHGGVWVADEIDAWDAAALLAANSALANGFCVFPDSPKPINRNPAFRVIATANTYGHGADRIYIGRNELDAASLDRFAVLPMDYDRDLERMYANGNTDWLNRVWKIREEVTELKIRHVVSSRAIIMGSAALQIGLSQTDVEEYYLFKGMSEKDREKLTKPRHTTRRRIKPDDEDIPF